jgi:thimet oligopeptidase
VSVSRSGPPDGVTGAADFPSRSPAEIEALTTEAIERADRRIEAALGDPQDAKALLRALDDAGRIVALAYGEGAFLRYVHPDPDGRDAAAEAAERIEKWRATLPQREDLAAAIARVADGPGSATLDADEAAVVRAWQADIRNSGVALPPPERAEARRLLDRLIELQGLFIGNLSRVTTIELTMDELEGLPSNVIAGLEPGSKPGTFSVPINQAIGSAVLDHARRRDVRERVDRILLNQGMPENQAHLDEAVAIRKRLARLLGYDSWLELRAATFAAGHAEVIERFIAEVDARLAPIARRQIEAMREILVAEPGAPADLVVEDWDWRYADNLQRAALGASPEAVRAYLAFDDVFRGFAALSEEVFGIRLVERPERRGWHPDVRAFDMVDRDSGTPRARMFFDPYVRPGKQGGAFADMLDPGESGQSGPARLPVMALVTNAAVPSNEPSLFGPEQLDMLFHEYGHVLDFALGSEPFVLHRPDYWVPMDWVEGPSQFLGRWGQHPGVIARFARHHQTGQPIPSELLDAMGRLESLNAAVRAMRHLSMGRLDTLLHGPDPLTVDAANRASWPLRGTPFPEGTCFPAGMIHLLGGYDGAVYGFVWSQVLRDDLMSRFEAEGLTSPAAGAAYRASILDPSWTRPPLDGLATFLGRPWSMDAFLARQEGEAPG